ASLSLIGPRSPPIRPELQRQNPRPDQVGEALALVVVQQGVQLAQRAGDGVGEPRQRAPAVDLPLSALGLQIPEDARQLRHLSLVQLQLVGQESQRSPDAEGAAAEPRAFALLVATVVAAAPMPAAATGTTAPAAPTALWRTPPGHHVSVHVRSPSSFRRGLQLPAGFPVGDMPHGCPPSITAVRRASTAGSKARS